MNSPRKNKQVASPISTGGGGPDLERNVGAYYLALTLLRSIPRGRSAGVTREVRFQRLRGVDRFGIAVGLYSKTIDEHYQSVLTWARNPVCHNSLIENPVRKIV